MCALLEHTPAVLASKQAQFAEALFARDRVPQGLASSAPSRRFGIYRSNAFASLIGCLRSTYPAVRRLVGDEFFDAAAQVFVERNPPTSPVLLNYGGGFDGFLQSFGPAQDVPYLADVARLEWHIACAAHAKDAVAVDGAVLSRMAIGDAAQVRLQLHPSLRLMRSPFPVVSIWTMNTHGSEVRSIEASPTGEAALIVRPQFSIQVEQLDLAEFEFVAALGAGYALADAGELAVRRSGDFDLAATLVRIFCAGAVVDVTAGQREPLFQASL